MRKDGVVQDGFSETKHRVDLFWSMRSPYCYLALDRILSIHKDFRVDVRLRVVYPIAIRDPDFFRVRASKHYRTYHTIDAQRVADFYGIPFRRPVPDPIRQDMETGAIADEQPHVFLLTRLAQLAADAGRGLAFLDRVARLLWDGGTDDWDQGDHLARALAGAGLDFDEMADRAERDAEAIDAAIRQNEAAQDAAGHGGVPLMVFEGEPFFGQDRIDVLLWRMRQKGVTER